MVVQVDMASGFSPVKARELEGHGEDGKNHQIAWQRLSGKRIELVLICSRSSVGTRKAEWLHEKITIQLFVLKQILNI